MFTVDFNQAQLDKVFDNMQNRQIPFAASQANNPTAQVIKATHQQEMRSVFDRPTPFTINSLQLTPSSKTRLLAKVWFKNPPRFADGSKHYLEPQVYGSIGRPFKGAERLLQRNNWLPQGWYAIPGPSARMDSYGNMSRGQLVQILSALQSLPSGIGNRPAKYARGRTPKNLPNFVVVPPGSRQKPGVYLKGPNGSFKMVLRFVPMVTYRKRFSFFEIAQDVASREIVKQLDRAMQEATATAR